MAIIPIAKPVLGEKEVDAIGEVVRSGWVTQGPKVGEFEQGFAETVGSTHACAVANCTTALHAALLSVGVKPGDVVLTPSHSFIASANAIRYCGAEPVFVDIDAETFNLSPDDLSLILKEKFEQNGDGLHYRGEQGTGGSARLAAILLVHQMGMPADLGRIMPIATENKIPVIEDAACAAGSRISLDEGKSWEEIGRPHGEIACFSFHPRKIITTGEGGMLTTNNSSFDENFRLLRQHAMTVSDTARHDASRVIFEEYTTTGFNYRMTDMQAAMGIQQLSRLREIVDRRRELAFEYHDFLSGIDEITAPAEPSWARSNWQSYCVRLADELGQRMFMETMLEQGVSTRRGIMCAHREKPYLDKAADWPLTKSEKAQDQGVLLPVFHEMTTADMIKVKDALKTSVGKSRR